MKQFILLAALNFCLILTSVGQTKDAAVWENIYLQKHLTPRWVIHFNHEGRITKNVSQFHYGYGDFGLTYKFNKNFHATVDYVFVAKYLEKSGLSNRHQTYVALTYKKKIRPFVFSYRQMLQEQVQDIYSSELGKLPAYFSRSKLTIKWELNRFTPYVASELYVRLSEAYAKDPEHRTQPYGPHANRMRYFAGCFYELNKMNLVEAYYLIEQHFNENNPATNYVIGIGYAHEFY